MTKHSPSLNRADIAGAISSFYGVAADAAAIDKLAAVVFPDVQQASARDPASWKSVVPGVLAKYESMARELGLGVSASERDRAALRTANLTDATYAAAAGRLGADGLRQYAGRGEGRERFTGRGDSHGAGSNGRDSGMNVTAAISFAKELGISPVHAGLFAGGSQEMRSALKDAINNGKAIGEDKIKTMKDVGMVLGAIRAGKLQPDDPRIPQSVRGIIEDMKKKGIDPTKADQKTIKKYLDENPKALEAAKKEINMDKAASAGLTDRQLVDAAKKEAGKAAAAAKTKPHAAPKTATVTRTL